MATSVKLNDELKERLSKLAKAQERSPHWIMKKAIEEYVTKNEARESFKNEAISSLNDYRETGQYLTSQEVKEWLDSWGGTVNPFV